MYGVENYEDRTKETCSFFPCRKKWSNGDVHQEWWCTKGDVPVLQVHQFTFTKWSNRDVPGTHLFACQLTKTTAIGIKPICGCVVAPCGHLIQQWFCWSIPFVTLPKQNFGLVQRSNGLRPIARQIKFYTGVKCLTPSFFYSLLMQRRKNTTQWAPIRKSYTNNQQPPPPLHTYLLHLFKMWMHAPFH